MREREIEREVRRIKSPFYVLTNSAASYLHKFLLDLTDKSVNISVITSCLSVL